ncbi:MAG: rod shape-determining protein MreC [Oscillospiraceae bacterium]|nr:rod shape-determining protein MreC [Oscillospiraceae bacterium]
MKITNLFKIRAVKITLSALCCFACLIVAGIISGNYFISNIVTAVVYPFQQLGLYVSETVINLLPTSQTDEHYQNIINSQQEELNDIRNKLVNYEEIKKENSEYEKYYELKKNDNSLKFVVASVIGIDPDEKFHGFSINKGSVHGVSLNDPVMTSQGIVGYISNCNHFNSNVKTIFSPDSKIPCVIRETGCGGIIAGSITLSDKNFTKMMFLPERYSFSENSIVVTSGVCGKFPKNFLIGQTVQFDNDKDDGSRYVVVRPFADIKEITDVSVITDFFGKGQIN